MTASSRSLRPLLLAWLAAALVACVCAVASPAAAQTLGVSVVMTSDTALTLDSNKPRDDGPHSQYVAFEITNTSGATLNNLRATISGFAGGIALAGGQPATLYVGTLAPGARRTAYWFVLYPAGNAYGTANTLSVQVSDGASTRTATGRVRVVSMASASAGGFTNATTIGPGAVVGQLIDVSIRYEFKGWKTGETFNMQPAGNPDFAAGCFQLVRSTVTSADAPLNAFMLAQPDDRQFYVATTPSTGNGASWFATMRYTFRYMCAGAASTPLPYANSFSGGQLKYVWDGVAAGAPSIPAAPNPSASFAVTKSAAPSQTASGGVVTYTVAIQNTSNFNVTVDSIVDQLPSGAVFQGTSASSGVTAARSGSMPAAGSAGRLVWRGNPPTGGAGDASGTYYIAVGGTLNLVYTVSIPSAVGQYTNTATPFIGGTSLGTATATVTVGAADVAVLKRGTATAVAGDTVVYTIVTRNVGTLAASGVVVRDTLPEGVTYLSSSHSGAFAAGKVTWPSIASLAVGDSAVRTLTVLAPFAMSASLVNVASATTSSADPNPANNDGTDAGSRVTTAVTAPVAVTPDTGTLVRLKGAYSQVFAVANLAATAQPFHLLAYLAGAPQTLRVDSIRGPGVASQARADSALVTLARRSVTPYTVWYTVLEGDTATAAELLRARHTAVPAVQDTGVVTVRRVSPRMTLTKTVSPNGSVSPGATLTYTIAFQNAGSAAATQLRVSDALPPQVLFKVGSIQQTLLNGMTATAAFSKDGVDFTYDPSKETCGAPAPFNGCVTHILWTLSGQLAAGAEAGTIRFEARVR